MEARGNAQVIACKVPLSEMFGYATDLRSMSQGRAQYTMQFAAYEQAPKNVSEEIVAKAAGVSRDHREIQEFEERPWARKSSIVRSRT